jgi:hypothetical protein
VPETGGDYTVVLGPPDFGPHRVEAESVYFRDPLHRGREPYAIAVANNSPEYVFRLAPIYPQEVGEPR